MPVVLRWVAGCALAGACWCIGAEVDRLGWMLVGGIPLGVVTGRRELVLGHAVGVLTAMLASVVAVFAALVVVSNVGSGVALRTSWSFVGWAGVLGTLAVAGAVLGCWHGVLLRGPRVRWALAGAIGGIPAGVLLAATVDSARPTAALAGLAAGLAYGLVTGGIALARR